MKPEPAAVLGLVVRCAGRFAAPAPRERDEVSNRIRLVTAWLLRTGGHRIDARHAAKVLELNLRSGDSEIVDLLLVVIGQLALVHSESTPSRRRREPEPGPGIPHPPEAAQTVEPEPPVSSRPPPAPVCAAEGPRRRPPRRMPDVPRVRDCPPDRAKCRKIECRHWMADPSPHPCSLVLAHGGAMTLDAVGKAMGVCRERVRQLEERALTKLRAKGYRPEDFDTTGPRPLTYVERAELAAPGTSGLDLRGVPANWKR